MSKINLAQALWLFWNISWHSLWVFGGAIAATGIFHFFFQFSRSNSDNFLSEFQKDFSKITFPLFGLVLLLFRFFAPTFGTLFILATLLLRILLWLYKLLRDSFQNTKKQLSSTFLAHKPTSRQNFKNFFSLRSWEKIASRQISLFEKTGPSYFGGLFLVFLVGLIPASFLVQFISYSPNLILSFFQNILFGLILGLILPFSYLAKLPLSIYLADLGLSFAGIFSFFAAGLILVWIKTFFKKYSLKQTVAFSAYLVLGFTVIALIGQLLFLYLPWQKPLRIAGLNQEIAFNLDFFLNCLGVIAAIFILVIARGSKKLDFSRQINKIIGKIKKPRR